MKNALLLALSAALAFVTSCSSSTPQARIDANPGIYNSLTSTEKSLVLTGQIAKGMKPPAVFLAWGAPDQKSVGETESRSVEKWVYTRSSPSSVLRFSPYLGYGRGYGRYGRYGGYGGFGFGPQVIYSQRAYARVEFQKGRVTSWERNR